MTATAYRLRRETVPPKTGRTRSGSACGLAAVSAHGYHAAVRCEHCDYLLFNLMQPICPECGRSFDHERYRFDPGAVSFNCPHCDQVYYGNDEQGLPQPRQFVCVRCDSPVTLQQLRVVPTRDDALGRPAFGSPWDDRQRLGWRRAWWDTFLMTLVKPGQFFRIHVGRSTKEAWLFSMITMYVGFVPYCVQAVAFLWGFGAFLMPAGPGGGAGPGFPLGLFALVYGIMAVIVPLIGPFVAAAVWAVLIQLALCLLAPNRKPIGDTFRMAMYAFGPYALYAVPLCGPSVGGVWVLVTMIFGVKEVHQASGWRASIAVLWPVVVLVGLYFAFIVVIVVGSQAR